MNQLIRKIKEKSHETLKFWEGGAYGWAPPEASRKLDAARLDWLNDLTDCLKIWDDKGILMTEGEQLLAYANIGALVEGWLKLFYCVYYLDYVRNPIERNGVMVEPNDMKFESLKQFSRGILWDQGSKWDIWIEKIQKRRNAIHAFNDRGIGTVAEFLDDLKKYFDFICEVDTRLPYPD